MPTGPSPQADDLAHIFTWRESRTLTKNLTLQFHHTVYQIQVDRPSYAMRKAVVTVSVDIHRKVSILYKGKSLPYTTYHRQAKQSPDRSNQTRGQHAQIPETWYRPWLQSSMA